MQMLRGGQHFRVYGGNLHQRQFQHIPRTIQGFAQGRTERLHRLSVERGRANLLERDFERNHLTLTSMKTFDFYQDRKVTCWERTHFSVKTENYDKALEIIQSWKGEDVLNFSDDTKIIITDGGTLHETSESLLPQDNEGNPTIEVFIHGGEEIVTNKQA